MTGSRIIQNTLNKLQTEVSFDPRGKHELIELWPGFAYCSLIEPSADPINFKKLMAGADETVAFDSAVKEDFALPALMIWAPELRWPEFNPALQPKCPFHKTSDCVEHKGIGQHVRRCYARFGNVALAKRRYICTHRKDVTKENPYGFDSVQKDVMDLAPDYVQGYWLASTFLTNAASASS